MRRVIAAREGGLGLEITTLPAMAARLAGGFIRPATYHDVLPAIVSALSKGELADLGRIAELPGTPRAVARTLGDLWRTGTDLATSSALARAADLSAVDARVRAALPPGVLVPPDLRDAALRRIQHARMALGAVKLEGMLDVDPVWRPLLSALSGHVPLSWTTRGDVDRGWFRGTSRWCPRWCRI